MKECDKMSYRQGQEEQLRKDHAAGYHDVVIDPYLYDRDGLTKIECPECVKEKLPEISDEAVDRAEQLALEGIEPDEIFGELVQVFKVEKDVAQEWATYIHELVNKKREV